MTTELAYAFGYFRVLPERRTLLAGEQPIKVGARAFDFLVTFVESPEQMLTKSELIEAAWPRLVVEENNLNVQIVSLRKVLGHAAIVTIPGRGYRFTMPFTVEGDLRQESKATEAHIEERPSDEAGARRTPCRPGAHALWPCRRPRSRSVTSREPFDGHDRGLSGNRQVRARPGHCL